MKVQSLAQCKFCKSDVPAYQAVVKKKIPHPKGVMIIFECPFCDSVQDTFMLADELRRRTEDARLRRVRDEQRRQIGILVKGFAVDLEAVETLDDIKMFWDYQEQVKPASVPSEGGS